MTKAKRPKFVHVRYYQNKTKRGRPTATKVKQGVYYYSYGLKEENPDQLQRGHWYSRVGPERYGDVAAWAAGNALTQPYTYTLVLSLRDGRMQPQDFVEAMQQASDGIFHDWRLIPHYDTEHDHAHVIAFRDKTLSKKEFNQWRNSVADYLLTLEQQRLQEQEQSRQLTQSAEMDIEEEWLEW